MKLLAIIIAAISFVHPGFSQNKFSNYINVTYVDCSIETPFAISCDLFDSQFSSEKKHGLFDLIKFKNYLKKFVKIKYKGIDVRGKIAYQFHGHKFKYCFDQFGHFTDEKFFYKNTALFKIIKNKFREFCP